MLDCVKVCARKAKWGYGVCMCVHKVAYAVRMRWGGEEGGEMWGWGGGVWAE